MKIYPGERQALAIREAKRLGQELHQLSEDLRDRLESLDRSIIEIQSTDDAPELCKLRDRIEHIHELRRMMELGGFTIPLGHALDAAWKRLP